MQSVLQSLYTPSLPGYTKARQQLNCPAVLFRKSTVPGIKYVVLGCVLSASSCRVLLMVELAMQCIGGA